VVRVDSMSVYNKVCEIFLALMVKNFDFSPS
jgi:hypothetical protein